MPEAVIIDAVRTPIGRYGGALKAIRPDDLAALVVGEIVRRNNLDTTLVEDVILGAANQSGEDNRNVGRMAALLAGLPESVAGATVNRLCGSGLMAVTAACQAIVSGAGEVFIAGGVESMTRAPYAMLKPSEGFARGEQQLVDTTLGWRFVNKKLADKYYPYSMGETAENVAEKYKLSRSAQDEFALSSQEKYKKAFQSDFFKEEIVPVALPLKKGEKEPQLFATDEHARPETTMADLAKLQPAFREGGTVIGRQQFGYQ